MRCIWEGTTGRVNVYALSLLLKPWYRVSVSGILTSIGTTATQILFQKKNIVLKCFAQTDFIQSTDWTKSNVVNPFNPLPPSHKSVKLWNWNASFCQSLPVATGKESNTWFFVTELGFYILLTTQEQYSKFTKKATILALAQLDHFFGGAQTFWDLLIKLGPSRLIPLVRLILSFSLTSHILRFL